MKTSQSHLYEFHILSTIVSAHLSVDIKCPSGSAFLADQNMDLNTVESVGAASFQYFHIGSSIGVILTIFINLPQRLFCYTNSAVLLEALNASNLRDNQSQTSLKSKATISASVMPVAHTAPIFSLKDLERFHLAPIQKTGQLSSLHLANTKCNIQRNGHI